MAVIGDEFPPAWVIVTGAARSGTTILMEILNSNPNVGIFAEFPLDNMIDWVGNCFQHERKMVEYAAASQQVNSERPPWPIRSRHFAPLCFAPFHAVFPEKWLIVVGTKMPAAETRLDVAKIEASLGGLKFMHIVRNPLDVIASSIARRNAARAGSDFWQVETVEEAAADWLRAWIFSQENRARRPQDTCIVKYEDLGTRFAELAQEFAAFLGVGPGFHALYSPDAAARDLTPLSDAEKDYIERAFGDLDRDWPNSDLSGLFEILPIERAAEMCKHHAAQVEP